MKTTGLTIIEAIQSGLPFKREKWEYFGKFEANLIFFYWDKNKSWNDTHSLTTDDVIAQDWQIKTPEVTITREGLAEAWDKTVYLEFNGAAEHQHSVAFRKLCKSLGL